jgi:DNA-3-methyladenine glycosylase II
MPPISRRSRIIIETEDDVRRGIRALRRACDVMKRIHLETGDPPLRRIAPGFEGLARVVVNQQLSTASAAAIWGRLSAACAPFSAQKLLGLSDAELRAAGLSLGKMRTLRALAAEVAAGRLDIEQLVSESDETIHIALTAVHGIGPWTADIFLLFCLGRRDAFAAGDLALQIAVERAFGLRQRPTKDELLVIADRWRPWRAVAARLLWAHYALRPKA